jgi:hypothetical protein
MKNKRGQFFLIAAVVIIVITISIMTISNYTQSNDETNIDDLGDEMDIESKSVLDYWASNGKTDDELDELMETFIENYVNGLDNNKNIYFIFGNSEKIHFRGYQLATSECVCLTIDSITLDTAHTCQQMGGITPPCVTPQLSLTREGGITQDFVASDGGGIEGVVTSIGEGDYLTRINSGENFYFILWENSEGEKHIVISGE